MNTTKTKLPLYQRLLGKRYKQLPLAIQQLHNLHDEATYIGQCSVTRGNSLLAKLLTTLLTLPKTGNNLPIRVHFKVENNIEHWQRHFGNHVFYSKQWNAHDKLYEKIRMITFIFDLQLIDNGLKLKLEQIKLLGIPIKWIFKPTIIAEETEQDGKFHFYIHTAAPITGRLVSYQGWLEKKN